jgi:hypothetical protein
MERAMTSPLPVILIAANAHPLVQLAATEYQRYLHSLFGLQIAIQTLDTAHDPADESRLPDGASIIGEIGDPALVAVVETWHTLPKLSDQGFLLQSRTRHDRRALLIAGGSPVATLWAMYELVARYGVRYEMLGDVLPPPAAFTWLTLDERFEPVFRVRGLSPKNNLPESAASWDLPDYYRYINQMVKLRFNLFTWRMREWGPWLQYAFKDYRKTRADLFYGYRYPLDETSIGLEHFAGETEFYPRPFQAAQDDADRFRIARDLLYKVLHYARSRGLQVALALELTDLPTDLKEKINEWIPGEPVLAGNWANAHYSRTPLVEYGVNPQRIKWQNWAHPLIQELAETRIRALVDTFPDADFYLMEQTEHVASIVGFERSLDYLDDYYQIRNRLDREAMLRHAERYDFLAQQNRYEATLEGELEFLFFYDQLIERRRAFSKTHLPAACVGMTTGFVMQEYFSILPAVLRAGTVVQAILEYGLHRTAQRIDSLAPLQQSDIRTWLFSTFQDDNNMWLPQVCIKSLAAVAQAAHRYGAEGLNIQHWEVRPYEMHTRYLARLGWEPQLTPDAFYDEELTRIFGAAAMPLLKDAFAAWEEVDRFNREHLIGMAACWHGSFAKFVVRPDRFDPADIRTSIQGFQRVLSLLQPARALLMPSALPTFIYYENRLQCAVMYEELVLLGQQIGKRCQAIDAAAQTDRRAAEPLRVQAHSLVKQALRQAEAMLRHYAQDIAAVEDRAVLAGLNRWVWRYLQGLEDELRTKAAGEATLTDTTSLRRG